MVITFYQEKKTGRFIFKQFDGNTEIKKTFSIDDFSSFEDVVSDALLNIALDNKSITNPIK